MKLPIYQLDAFTDVAFKGNPAAVCVLDEWLNDKILQSIAAENNLSETAFFIATGDKYELRWFTPTCEVDLCGHATLAAAEVVLNILETEKDFITFFSKFSGDLTVKKAGKWLEMNFPSRPPEKIEVPHNLNKALGKPFKEVMCSRDMLVLFEKEEDIIELTPDFNEIAKLNTLGVIVTAPGNNDIDFVSRFFCPQAGILEDPVTGSAHCTLIPYWSNKLNKTKLIARQVSNRGGLLKCELINDRVSISGQVICYLKGEIYI
ncbi:MAG: PhzF family phenazine biosynthesis protein [Cyanobacteriota bacterium]